CILLTRLSIRDRCSPSGSKFFTRQNSRLLFFKSRPAALLFFFLIYIPVSRRRFSYVPCTGRPHLLPVLQDFPAFSPWFPPPRARQARTDASCQGWCTHLSAYGNEKTLPLHP